MDSKIYICVVGQVHLGWAKSSWIVHGALTHGSHGNENTWVLGFTWM